MNLYEIPYIYFLILNFYTDYRAQYIMVEVVFVKIATPEIANFKTSVPDTMFVAQGLALSSAVRVIKILTPPPKPRLESQNQLYADELNNTPSSPLQQIFNHSRLLTKSIIVPRKITISIHPTNPRRPNTSPSPLTCPTPTTATMVTESPTFKKAVEDSRKLKSKPTDDDLLHVRITLLAPSPPSFPYPPPSFSPIYSLACLPSSSLTLAHFVHSARSTASTKPAPAQTSPPPRNRACST